MGLINLEPTLHEGEAIVWRRPAAHSLRDRAVPGMLFLTSVAVLFMPNRLNRRRYIVSTRIPLDRLHAADTVGPVVAFSSKRNGGLRRRLRVTADDETHLFVINHPEQVAEELRAALRVSPERA
jgi:hypothetical protein